MPTAVLAVAVVSWYNLSPIFNAISLAMAKGRGSAIPRQVLWLTFVSFWYAVVVDAAPTFANAVNPNNTKIKVRKEGLRYSLGRVAPGVDRDLCRALEILQQRDEDSVWFRRSLEELQRRLRISQNLHNERNGTHVRGQHSYPRVETLKDTLYGSVSPYEGWIPKTKQIKYS